MTSWIQVPPRKQVEKNSFLFETTEAGFCSQFNNYLYSAMYATSVNTPLYVNDTTNAVSLRYPLIKNTFVNQPNVTFTDTQVLSATSLMRKSASQKIAGVLLQYLNMVEKSKFREMARKIFAWNPSLLLKIQTRLDDASFPDEIDVGVHMRAGDKIITGESKDISVETYINAIRKYQKESKKKALTIFVMTDSSERLEELKRKKDSCWNIVTLGYPVNVKGHTQRDFNAAPSQTRMSAYIDFMSELFLMQTLPQIICTYSSNIGRFLYLTADDSTSVVSMDMPVFSPV